MKTPISGTLTIEEEQLYRFQQRFFSRLKEKTLYSGILDVLTSEDELSLYTSLPSQSPGHSIMRFSAPQSTSNWAVEPLEFKLLGARIVRGYNTKFEYIPKDVEAVDVKGTFDAKNKFFRDFTLVYKSAMKKTPDTYLNYSLFEPSLEASNQSKPFEINYKVRSTPQEVRNYMPLFETYFGACIDYFFPKNFSHTYNSREFDDFREDILKNVSSNYEFNTPLIGLQDISSQAQNDPVLVNDILVRDYLKLLK